jgi:hypothetical protein
MLGITERIHGGGVIFVEEAEVQENLQEDTSLNNFEGVIIASWSGRGICQGGFDFGESTLLAD